MRKKDRPRGVEDRLEQVAAESGISKMTVYRHFGSKEELFAALVDAMCAQMAAKAAAAPLPLSNRPLDERLTSEARAFTTALTQPDAIGLYRLIVAEGWRFPTLARTFQLSGIAVLRSRIEAILEAGDAVDDQIAARASGFINLVLGDAYLESALGLYDGDQPPDFTEQIETAVAFALSAQRVSRPLK